MGGSERETGTPILNPLLNPMQVATVADRLKGSTHKGFTFEKC